MIILLWGGILATIHCEGGFNGEPEGTKHVATFARSDRADSLQAQPRAGFPYVGSNGMDEWSFNVGDLCDRHYDQ